MKIRITKAPNRSNKDNFGGDFSNGVVQINAGGLHSTNPNEGVLMGHDENFVPNMVEEGEVVWEDYVFSNRLKPTKEFKDKYKVKGDTFADVAKYIQKESSERPNDPISKLGLKDSLEKLQLEQEQVRNSNKKISNNGKHLFSGGGGFSTVTEVFEDTESPELNPDGPRKRRKSDSSNGTTKDDITDLLRYAPVFGSAIGVMNDLFSRPDYSNAKAIERAANKAGIYTPVSYTPVGNYLEYNPLDRNYYLNKLQSSSNASRRAIVDQSNGNRATAVAGILASDYNTQGKMGDLIRQAEEYNLAQRQHIEDFNRNTNATNSKMAMQASLANQEARAKAAQQRMAGITTAAQLRESIDASRSAARSANLTNLFDNLAGIAIDKDNRAYRDFYIKNVMAGKLPIAEYAKLYGKDKAIEEAKARGFSDVEIDSIFKKYGGKINRKKKGGFTY